MGRIAPKLGLDALERVFAAKEPLGGAQIAIVPIEWQELQEQASLIPFLSDFRVELSDAKPAVDTELLKRIQASPLLERKRIVEEHLSAQLAQVLGWSSERVVDTKQGFFDTGMDSLTSLELRNLIQRSFGCALPSTVAFDYPNIEALAGYLMQEVPALSLGGDPAKEEVDAASASTEPALSSAQIREMLDEKLMSLEALLGDSNGGAGA